MTGSVIVTLPFFPGFYESALSGILDHAEERECEYLAQRETSQADYPESYQPERLRLDAGDWAEIMLDCLDYGAAHAELARDYCASFDRWAADNLATPPASFSFESMTSPRFYNFETDRVFVEVPFEVVEAMRAAIGLDTLRDVIEARHTSRSGFHSYYSSDLAAWLAKPLALWDHNELATLLCACIAQAGFGEHGRGSDFQWEICEPLAESDHHYLDRHCDWRKLDRVAMQRRAAKLAEWIRDDPDHVAAMLERDRGLGALLAIAVAEHLDPREVDSLQGASVIYADAHYRCPFTRDLFADS